MAASPYIVNLRRRIGHDLLLLPGVSMVVFNNAGEILMQRRSDSGQWGLLGGIPDPGEEPAACAAREVLEETGLHVTVQRLVGVYASSQIHYPNGDTSQYIAITFACLAEAGEPKISDEESLDLKYFPPSSLPKTSDAHRQRIDHALSRREAAFFVPPPP